jgi:hypothetical protein
LLAIFRIAVVQPPHRHGALLLAGFLLGPECQDVLSKFGYGSAAKNRGFKRWRPDLLSEARKSNRRNEP